MLLLRVIGLSMLPVGVVLLSSSPSCLRQSTRGVTQRGCHVVVAIFEFLLMVCNFCSFPATHKLLADIDIPCIGISKTSIVIEI